ncbi:DUF6285 domain-containing protein [Pollutimonas sp. M17]|uniref:DUF6285 domain-containing protein n=1 Tax=Pollutimonas sp. M17 TaxID=2962065 RepID=UPI0021F4A6C1|nr:DUF6285 domain-containing protein [Pollutimonas sp. M17]UYO92754.1 DUF6285 domain-containing protein [Pollutimonas sp. M17]
MNNRPYGNELLDVARRTLLDELLPLLPGEKAYEALMVANAMAIASRELAPHAADDRAARREIQRFLADIGQGDAVEPTEHALAAQIRKRAVRGADSARLHQLLLTLTRAKLLLSNPRHPDR